eukprot:COSAG05_NODE_162_length_15499_cov_23.006104_2_plen_301_part_00
MLKKDDWIDDPGVPCAILMCNSVRSGVHVAMIDTGCSPVSVMCADISHCLLDRQISAATYRGAFGSSRMKGLSAGSLPMQIVDGNGVPTGDKYTVHIETVDKFNQNLLSYHQLHQDGFDLHIDGENAILRHRHNGMVIPLIFDAHLSAWFVHFKCSITSGEFSALSSAFYDDNEHADNIDAALGGKSGIRGGNKMTQLEFHCWQGHIGYHKDCWICNAIQKSTRRVHHEHDRFVETRPGFQWNVDLVTFNFNFPARDGSLYFACVRDRTTKFPCGFSLIKKSDFGHKLVDLITDLRQSFQ